MKEESSLRTTFGEETFLCMDKNSEKSFSKLVENQIKRSSGGSAISGNCPLKIHQEKKFSDDCIKDISPFLEA